MAHLRIDRVLGFEHGIPPVFGVVAAVGGVLFLLFGWRLYRITVALAGFLIGAFIGQLIAGWIQVKALWGAMVGGAALALLAEPLNRVVVFVLAGLAFGVLLGEGLRWLRPTSFLWGFVPGFLVGGLFSLWQLRPLVVLSTAFLGSLATLWGCAVAVSAWLYRPAGTFHARHPHATGVIFVLLFLVGCAAQFRLASRRRPDNEED